MLNTPAYLRSNAFRLVTPSKPAKTNSETCYIDRPISVLVCQMKVPTTSVGAMCGYLSLGSTLAWHLRNKLVGSRLLTSHSFQPRPHIRLSTSYHRMMTPSLDLITRQLSKVASPLDQLNCRQQLIPRRDQTMSTSKTMMTATLDNSTLAQPRMTLPIYYNFRNIKVMKRRATGFKS